MKVYDVEHIRNIALVGHQGSGKTMLTEAMLLNSGAVQRMGSIAEGTTVSDYHPSEKERQMSVFSSLVHVDNNGVKLNVLDVPGYPDFVGEMIMALKVADTAVFVINAAEGIQVGTETAWKEAEEHGIPAMFVLNQLDRSEANFRDLVGQIRERFGRGAAVVQLPAGPGSRGIIDVLLMKQLTFGAGKGEVKVGEIDPAFKEEADQLHNELIESIAENDETLMERYFEQGSLSEDEMRHGLHVEMLKRQLFPIFIASATENIGVSRLMQFIANVCPSPIEMPPAATDSGDPVKTTSDGPPVAFVYRTMAEAHVGEYSFFRVYSGVLEQGMDLENAQTGATERLGQLYAINGHERDQVAKMFAGDIGALVKLKNTHSNNTLRAKGSNVAIKGITFPEPRYVTAVRPQKQGEEDKLAQGLHALSNEDPSLVVTLDPHLSQMLLGGQGEMHLAIAQFRLKNRFGVDMEYIKPRISYRETIQNTARAAYRHKKQTGGAGQFADISLLVEPYNGDFKPPADISVRGETVLETAWGAKLHFVDAIVGGVIDMRRFAGSIQKGILEAMQRGPIAGYPVGDVRVVIFDGSMHAVDSNDAAFKTAGRMGFRDAFRQAQPVILEPICTLEVMVPGAYTGEVMGDLNVRRGRIQGIEGEGVLQKIVAQVPEAELYRYATILRSMTQGRGLHKASFLQYEPMPRNIQDKVTKEAEEEVEA
ncbi:MAG: elongation factor G [Rhodothermales bacterium]